VIEPNASVREIIRRHPAAREVFERFGLMGCGGEEGPDEPLQFFARVHHVDAPELLTALNQAVAEGSGEPAPVQPSRAPVAPARVFVPFFLASLALTLTLGATLGMINLARLTTPWFGGLPRPSVWAHAYVQVFGFVGLFVMGVAYHVIPRFVSADLGDARAPRRTLLLQLAGVALVSTAFLVPSTPSRLLWIAGTIALTVAAALFASAIAATIRTGRGTGEPFERWVLAGLGWLVASSVVAMVAAASNDTTWHRVLWEAALMGFAASWIFGVGRRIFPVFLGWQTRWPHVERPAFILYQGSAVLWAVGAWPAGTGIFGAAQAAGAVGLTMAILLYASAIGVFAALAAASRAALSVASGRNVVASAFRRKRGVAFAFSRRGVVASGFSRTIAAADPTHGYERYIYAAWLWLLVGLAFGPVWTLASLIRGGAGSVLVADFARHAIAFGFVTQMIAGVASRVLPVFTGKPLWSPRLRSATFWLINGAVVVRGLEVVVAVGPLPAAWPWIALSAVPAVLGVGLFAVNVAGTIAGRPPGPLRSAPDVPLPDRLVAEIIEIPGALDILVEAGFTPLRQPLMRATFARTVTLGQACRLKNVDLQPLVARIEALRPTRAPAKAILLKHVSS
jgi:hypothetical protein